MAAAPWGAQCDRDMDRSFMLTHSPPTSIRSSLRQLSGAFPTAGRSFSLGCGTVPLLFSPRVASPTC
eukprot:2397976-Prymnesium_polylepis.2